MNPALRLLLRIKLYATLRKQVRRLRTPAGILFALVGLALVSGWILMLVLGAGHERPVIDPARAEPIARAALAAMLCVAAASSLSHRGLYLPAEEIERLLSAPVTRSDLVRYRLVTNAARSLPGALILGFVVGRWTPVPLYGFCGGFLAVQTMGIAGQTLSILAGDAENRLLARLPKRGLRAITVAGGLVIGLTVAFLVSGGSASLRETGREFGLEGLLDLLNSPPVRALTTPLVPWTATMLAPGAGAFLRWGAFSALAAGLLFELCARLPIDFRELSLETSADVARRLRRARRGGVGASAGQASRRTAGWRIPWLFGHGPFGALAWRKLVSILRKARGTALTSILVLALLITFTTLGGFGPEEGGREAALFVALLGTIYLCGALRFDFRDDLDQMAVVKSWPVRPAAAFLATLLPEVLLVGGLVAAAVVTSALLSGALDAATLGIAAAAPLIALLWIALDNAVWLFAPVRYLPGQDGALQHSGRMMVVVLIRMLVLAAVLGLALAAAWLGQHAALALGLSDGTGFVAAVAAAGAVAVAAAAALVWLGGRMLSRFDVARDRG